MSSIQTEYREKRVFLLKSILGYIIDLLLLQRKKLSRIPLPKLKALEKEVEDLVSINKKRGV